MSFNSNIPQATDLISVSQQDLLNNFTSMQSTYTTDHYGFNPLTNLGYHKQITLVDDPLVVRSTAAGRLIEYAVTTNAQTYPVLQRDGLATVYQALPIKAYCVFIGSNVGVGNPLVSTFTLPYANVASITYLSTGRYRVTFVDAFPNVNYSALVTFGQSTANWAQLDGSSNATTSAVIQTINSGGNVVDFGQTIVAAFIN